MMGSNTTDYSLSIEQLEKSKWSEAPTDSTAMVQRCHSLRTKALENLAPDEIGLAVRQRIGIPFVLDLAMEKVRENLLYEGEHYPGDVLAALVHLPDEEWNSRLHLNPKA